MIYATRNVTVNALDVLMALTAALGSVFLIIHFIFLFSAR